jgi:hypothetical protein
MSEIEFDACDLFRGVCDLASFAEGLDYKEAWRLLVMQEQWVVTRRSL